MKENKKTNGKGFIITIGIAAIMVALVAVLLNTLLAHAATADDSVVHEEPISQLALNKDNTEDVLQDNLNTIIYLGGHEPVADGVTAQYAIAVTTEIAERVYGKELTGRLFARLCEPYNPGEGLYWDVTAEVDDGIISCYVDAASGIDRTANHSAMAADWSWFDAWNEETAEQERLEAEQIQQEIIQRDQQLQEESPQFSEEELAELLSIKRDSMLEFAASVADKSHSEKAIELVNSLGIGDGATATSAAIMMEGEHNDNVVYIVEVALDNGKYVILKMDQTTMELLAYERSNMDLATLYYG